MSVRQHKVSDLLRRCAETGSQTAWLELWEALKLPLGVAVHRAASTWADATREDCEELVQEVFFRIYRKSAQILEAVGSQGDEELIPYLRRLAQRVVIDQLKARVAAKRDRRHEVRLNDLLDLASRAVEKQMEQELLFKSLDEILRRELDPSTSNRDRHIYWIHHRSGLSASEISKIPGIGLTTKGLESLFLRLTNTLKKSVLSTEGEKPRPVVKVG